MSEFQMGIHQTNIQMVLNHSKINKMIIASINMLSYFVHLVYITKAVWTGDSAYSFESSRQLINNILDVHSDPFYSTV